MKQIINRKTYDTETAKKLGQNQDFTLYLKNTGELFIRRIGAGIYIDNTDPQSDEYFAEELGKFTNLELSDKTMKIHNIEE